MQAMFEYGETLVRDVEEDVDALSDQRERTFYNFSHLCDTICSAWQALMGEDGQKAADEQVRSPSPCCDAAELAMLQKWAPWNPRL